MTSIHFSEEAWVPGGERHQLSLTTSEAPGDWARGTAPPRAARVPTPARARRAPGGGGLSASTAGALPRPPRARGRKPFEFEPFPPFSSLSYNHADRH